MVRGSSELVQVVTCDGDRGWSRAHAGRRMDDRRRGHSVVLEARERVASARVWMAAT